FQTRLEVSQSPYTPCKAITSSDDIENLSLERSEFLTSCARFLFSFLVLVLSCVIIIIMQCIIVFVRSSLPTPVSPRHHLCHRGVSSHHLHHLHLHPIIFIFIITVFVMNVGHQTVCDCGLGLRSLSLIPL